MNIMCKVVIVVSLIAIVELIIIIVMHRSFNRILSSLKKLSQKHLEIAMTLNKFLIMKQQGWKLTDWFQSKHISSIAIYGMGYIGERLYTELKSEKMDVRYAIDKNASAIYTELKIKTMGDRLDEVDAVVVTAVYYYEEIANALKHRMVCPILSIDDILDDILNR